jgi:hypothetical protein
MFFFKTASKFSNEIEADHTRSNPGLVNDELINESQSCLTRVYPASVA